MEKNSTELVFILDKSGSMAGLEADTIGGFNSMLKKQRGKDGECRVTTVLFSDNCRILHDRIDINAVSPLAEKDYGVGGSTALLDAIGATIQKIASVQKNTAEEYRAKNVMFVIITDGEENSSREYSPQNIRHMIGVEKEKYGWEFIFLGANIDAVKTAGEFGISADMAADYIADSKGTGLNFKMMDKAITSFRQCGSVPQAAMESIRQDAAKRGKRRR